MAKEKEKEKPVVTEKVVATQKTVLPEPKLPDIKTLKTKEEIEIVIPPFLQEAARRRLNR